jgi:hypothetical protein
MALTIAWRIWPTLGAMGRGSLSKVRSKHERIRKIKGRRKKVAAAKGEARKGA